MTSIPAPYDADNDPIGTPHDVNQLAWSRIEFARKRMRRFYTTDSWDFSKYSNPISFPDTTIPPANRGTSEDKNVAISASEFKHAGRIGIVDTSTLPPTVLDLGDPSDNFGEGAGYTDYGKHSLKKS